MNRVTSLLCYNFSDLPFEQKCAIKALGRPTPPLDIRQQQHSSRGKDYTRQFKSQLYNRNSWICGCELENKLFCFPCLLFCKGEDSTWTSSGVSDLSHLTQKIKKHELSLTHKNACLDLSILGRTEIRQQFSEAFRQNVEKNNDQVHKNRYVLSKIIDCIRFCGEFELGLLGHNERDDPNNPGIFKGLVNFSAALDSILKSHLEVSTVFNGTSKEIQNDLLDCMLHVCHQNILEEILSADFVSVIADETTDVSTKAQMVVVFRYVVKSGMPVERFWTFLNPKHHDAEALFTCIQSVLLKVLKNDKNKLISQSYDGTNVMSEQFTAVQALVKEEYPKAQIVHCYAHQLSLIMVQATSQNKETRIFLANLQEVCTFFNQSLQRTDILNEIITKRLPSGSSTRWSYNLRSVLTVHQNIEALIECFEKIEESATQISTLNKAQGLKLKLKQPEFQYWLKFFSKVMPHVDTLYSSLEKKNINPVEAKEAISSFQTEVQKVRDNVESLTIKDESSEPIPKRNRVENCHTLRNEAAKEVCDAIAVQAACRFEFTGHLVAANLFDNEIMPTYKKRFPEDILSTTVESFDFLDKNKLRSELKLIYNREDFKDVKKITHLLGFLLENHLEECFSETAKLLKVLITIPMTSAESERCFSSLKRIKTFLSSTMEEERLNALAMLSIEKDMSRKIPDFNEKVIDYFAAKKERQVDFQFKRTSTARIV